MDSPGANYHALQFALWVGQKARWHAGLHRCTAWQRAHFFQRPSAPQRAHSDRRCARYSSSCRTSCAAKTLLSIRGHPAGVLPAALLDR
jgi:hypothetical protein